MLAHDLVQRTGVDAVHVQGKFEGNALDLQQRQCRSAWLCERGRAHAQQEQAKNQGAPHQTSDQSDVRYPK
ncbi:hypothetical protein D9M68_826370 [compost metagenome]